MSLDNLLTVLTAIVVAVNLLAMVLTVRELLTGSYRRYSVTYRRRARALHAWHDRRFWEPRAGR